VDPQLIGDALRQTRVTGGKFVRAGDRFESLWPGYAIVQLEKVTPRYEFAVRSAQLTADRRTLVLATDPHPAAVHYGVTLGGMGRPALDKMPKGTLPQHPAIDLDFDLTGCEAKWTPANAGPTWAGWLPHLDLDVARALTAGSASHAALWTAMEQPGVLTLRGQFDLTDMLRPAVQPGAQLDYEYPPETVSVAFASSNRLELVAPTNAATKQAEKGASFTLRPERNKTAPFEVRLTTRGGAAGLTVHWSTNEDSRPRPFPLRRILVPWADTSDKTLTEEFVAAPPPPELAGGSWARGRKEFFGEEAACAKCHAIHGKGGDIGPDLSNLVHRDYASVLRDIANPSFALNPDHLTYTVSLKDGRVLTGVVRSAGDKVRIGDTKGVVTELAKADIDEMRASPISTMPEGIPKLLGPERMRDLMTFLLAPPRMPRDRPGPRPKPRTVIEVNAVLAGAPNPAQKTRPIRVVLVAGKKDHGPGEHDYPAWQKAWAELLAAADRVEVAKAFDWPAKDEFAKADVIVIYQRGDWNAQRAADVDAFLERGGGLVYIHWAVDGQKESPGLAKRIGLSWGAGAKFRHGPLELTFDRNSAHPIGRNLDKLSLVDESYWALTGTLPEGRVIAWGTEEKQARPLLWSLEKSKGRVFVSIPGHYSWTFDDPLFRVVLLRGIAWAAREPVDRFNELVWPGANVGH
jgi:putative heme-binding domain-containing protein